MKQYLIKYRMEDQILYLIIDVMNKNTAIDQFVDKVHVDGLFIAIKRLDNESTSPLDFFL